MVAVLGRVQGALYTLMTSRDSQEPTACLAPSRSSMRRHTSARPITNS